MPTPLARRPSGDDDPLAPVGARVSLAVAFDDLPVSDLPPSSRATRPFVLRVAGVPALRRTSTLPPARYCPHRQIAVTDDEATVPVYRMGYDRTTIGSKDGGENPMEDWKPDL